MPALEKIRQLVERFEVHREVYRSGKYNEAQDKEHLGWEIESTDRAIDCLIYELYGLTHEEIAIVEGNG